MSNISGDLQCEQKKWLLNIKLLFIVINESDAFFFIKRFASITMFILTTGVISMTTSTSELLVVSIMQYGRQVKDEENSILLEQSTPFTLNIDNRMSYRKFVLIIESAIAHGKGGDWQDSISVDIGIAPRRSVMLIPYKSDRMKSILRVPLVGSIKRMNLFVQGNTHPFYVKYIVGSVHPQTVQNTCRCGQSLKR
jgi:hypothetical protein